MSEASKDSKTWEEDNKIGPNYFGYYKHLVSDVYSQDVLPFAELDSKSSAGSYSQVEVGGIIDKIKDHKVDIRSVSHFAGGIVQGLSDLKQERLRSILNQSVDSGNRETNMMLDQILAIFQIKAKVGKKESSRCNSSDSDDDVREPFSRKKRKVLDYPVLSSSDTQSSQTFEQVYHPIKALQGSREIDLNAVGKYSDDILAKLDKMGKDLDEFLDFVLSKSRPMIHAEKQQLGRKIRKLPNKALDRVVQLTSSPSSVSDDIHVKLEEKDNRTLWRLYYYVETVLKANGL